MRALAFTFAASVALVALYLALGGASYAPAQVADPCAQRDWRGPSGLSEVAEQIVLSALDGAACELEVPREEIVLAFESPGELERFASRHGIDVEELEQLVRTGFLRAIGDAERAEALSGSLADELRDVVGRVPVRSFLELLPALESIISS